MDNNKFTRPSLELRSPSADGIEEIAKNHGGKIQTEKSYPYTSGGGTSKGKCRAKDAKAIDAGITGYTQGKREKIEWYNCHVLSVLSECCQSVVRVLSVLSVLLVLSVLSVFG